MSLPPLPADAVALAVEVDDWQGAVRAAGAALTAAGIAKPSYADEMIRMIEQHGPYVVIAPGLALAHARPGPEVLKDGIAVVTLAVLGPFVKRFGKPAAVVTGLLFGVLGLAGAGLAANGLVIWWAVPLLALWGLSGPAVQGLMSRHVGANEQGQLQGANASLTGISELLGPTLFSLPFALAASNPARVRSTMVSRSN